MVLVCLKETVRAGVSPGNQSVPTVALWLEWERRFGALGEPPNPALTSAAPGFDDGFGEADAQSHESNCFMAPLVWSENIR